MAAYPVPGRWLLTHKKQKQPRRERLRGLLFLPSGPRKLDAQGPGETRHRVAAFVAIFIAVFFGHIAKNRRKNDKICKGEFEEDDGNVFKIRINAEKHRTSKECSVNPYGGGEGSRTPEQMPKTLLFPALSPTRCRFHRHFGGRANRKTRRPARQHGSASPPSRADKPAGPCGLMRAPYDQRYTC